jgi:acyl-coenzyme A thioesterase 9
MLKVVGWTKRLIPARRSLCSKNGLVYNKVQSFDVEKTPITAQLWKQRQDTREKHASAELDTGPKVPVDTTISYNFSENSLRDLYVDLKGEVLLGKLFEDFDSIAGNIAFAHCFNKSNQDVLSLVTAAVDYIKMSKNKTLSASVDYKLCGKVIWVGRSSLDVVVELHEARQAAASMVPDDIVMVPGDETLVLSSVFTYVARDKNTKKSYEIMNKLSPQTPSEVAHFDAREKFMLEKKAMKKAAGGSGSGLLGAPHATLNVSETTLQHHMARGRSLLDMPSLSANRAILMSATNLENSFITQPQNVNTGGKVFGGLLIHRAYDLALATSYTFAGKYPRFQEVEEISFKHPVDVGDLVKLKSRVVYTKNEVDQSIMQVEVTCQIIKLDQMVSVVSNTFDFVFSVDARDLSMELKEIAPATLEEAAVHLAARKHFREGAVE